jgi:two-component system cell cycle sensor histidine kinase/response regulator CckA
MVNPKTILLVDDELALCRLFEAVLVHEGYRLIIAHSVATALTAWKENGGVVDLLITDVFMPHSTGPDLARVLFDRQPGLKVIYISGGDRDEVLARLPEGSTLLPKPMVMRQITQQVEEMIGKA